VPVIAVYFLTLFGTQPGNPLWFRAGIASTPQLFGFLLARKRWSAFFAILRKSKGRKSRVCFTREVAPELFFASL
jgi:hypothetical protein